MRDEKKEALRKTLLAWRGALDPAWRASANAAAVAHLLSHAWLGQAERVALYCAIRGELDPAPLLAPLWQMGKILYLPRLEAGASQIRFARHQQGEVWQRGPFGIPQPGPDRAQIEPGAVDLMLVPLVGFDAQGGRLGYGGGFYDRTLAGQRPKLLVGLGFAGQQVEHLPRADHDIPLDAVVTETGWCFFGEGYGTR
ncbi:5-formyltetrahydrofolate cyclo-ligase [Magnetococcus marinus MC-1]|uniref:5-formyltetrahydrofolate cyclo-ligase n=1 Tax=Magnetococcus marinus (strain ATCC BAA-1437 / JCM 17883 / MC-1) TaxID=156889 RepID=A0L5J2_MAGMM|nr:5-formyltetrahydrofolate cyclo-ligase [Magnetococcus marinus]ABK43235.1 5-formyltetrahydrofolate cyclo-ligase [Magnetococcus marinus MC-1]